MRFPIIFCCSLSLISSAIAQPPLVITEAGYFITILDGSGRPEMVQCKTVIDLRGKQPPVVPDTPTSPKVDIPITPPTPTVDLSLAKEVQSLVKSLSDPQASQAVAVVYSHIKGAVADDTLDGLTLWPALRAGTDKAIAVTNSKADWAKFRTHISKLATVGVQQGKLDDNRELVDFLASI